MAITNTFYNSYKAKLMNGANINLASDTIKIALLSSSYTPDFDTHDFFDDVTGELANGTGYTSGGNTLASPVVSQDNTDNEGVFDCADPTWTFTAVKTFRYAVIYKSTGVAGTSPLIFLIDFGEDITTSAVFSLLLAAEGLININ